MLWGIDEADPWASHDLYGIEGLLFQEGATPLFGTP